jgi:hypothetical protein
MSMSFTYTQYFDHNKIYNILSSVIDKGIGQRKMVCNPTRQAGSPTQHGSHIYTQVGCGHNEYLFHPSPHLLLVVDLVTGEPNTWKNAMEKTHSYHTGKEEFMDRMSRVHQSTERIYTDPAWTRKETCKCQITQYLYMWNIITHTLVRVVVVSMSDRAQMSWLLDVSFFMMVTSRNGKMRRNRSIGTINIHVLIPIIWHVKNKFQIIWHVNNKELFICHMKIHTKNS